MCSKVECYKEYNGESERISEERVKEHPRAPSLINDHANTADHQTSVDNFTILDRKSQNLQGPSKRPYT